MPRAPRKVPGLDSPLIITSESHPRCEVQAERAQGRLRRLVTLSTAYTCVLWVSTISAYIPYCLANPQSGFESVPSVPIVVGLPTAYTTAHDQIIVQPQVQLGAPTLSASEEMNVRLLQTTRPSAELTEAQPLLFAPESLPAPPILERVSPADSPPFFGVPSVIEAPPIFENLIGASLPRLSPGFDPCAERGLGYERLAFSLFDIDPAQPFNNIRVRSAFGSGMQLPDRAEFFWGRTVDRRGPPNGESVLDYQDLRLRMELGSKRFSTTFEVPFRAVDPVINKNHAGLGDLQLITKTVLWDGERWMLTQYFGTQFPTGSSRMGLGTGHVGLEPGFLFRNKWSEQTWLHGELKFWFPLGADPEHHGQTIKFATGINRVWRETDADAIVPSFELTTFSILNGLARDSTNALRRIDGDSMLYMTPGVRYIVDPQRGGGLFEVGSALSFAVTGTRFTDTTMLLDIRWSW